MSDASRVQVRYLAESTWGTTPSAAMTNFRATSANLKPVNATVTSEEIRSDGQVTDEIRVGVAASASIGYELSYGALDDFLAAALRQTGWTADTGLAGAESGTDLLENGTTLRSFTLESEFSDITTFASVTGARIDSLTMNFANQERVTGSVDFMGKIAALGGSTVGTGSATAAPTADVLAAVNLSGIEEGGSAAELISLSLTIANGARQQNILGTAAASMAGIGFGRFQVTGTLEAYFASATLANKYINHTASSLGWTVTDGAGNVYEFSIPRVRYSDADFPASGNDQDVILTMPFRGLLDATTGKTLRISRTDA